MHFRRTAPLAQEHSTFNLALQLASRVVEMGSMQTLLLKLAQLAILHAPLALEEQLRLVLLAHCLLIFNLRRNSAFLLVIRTNTSKTLQLLV